jgi:hypothetical protein
MLGKLLLISKLFMDTKSYTGRKKESLGELRRCYELYTKEYISEEEFRTILITLGFVCNKNGEFKLKMRPEIRKQFFN